MTTALTEEQKLRAQEFWNRGVDAWAIAKRLKIPVAAVVAWAQTQDNLVAPASSGKSAKTSTRAPRERSRAAEPSLPRRVPVRKPAALDDVLARIDQSRVAKELGIEEATIVSIVRSLHAGEGRGRVAWQHGIRHEVLKPLLGYIGWSRSWVDPLVAGKAMVGALPLERVLALYREGVRLQVIADQAKVSRERIRAVAEREGLAPRRPHWRRLH